jgi:hypothetical protein
MKTLKYIVRVIPFFKSWSKNTEEKTVESDTFEFTYPKLGINFNQGLTSKKGPKSLLTQMYSEENETLFI